MFWEAGPPLLGHQCLCCCCCSLALTPPRTDHQKCKRMEKSFKAGRPKALPGVHVQGCGDMGRKGADTQCPVTSAHKSWVLRLYCVLNKIMSMQNPTKVCFSLYTQMQRWRQLLTTQHPVLSHWEPSHKPGVAGKCRKYEIHRLAALCSHRPFHAWEGIWQTSLLAQLWAFNSHWKQQLREKTFYQKGS